MKVYHLKEDNRATEHEPVDAREIVASDPEAYSLINPESGELETPGTVLRRSSELRHDENMRSQYDQHAQATAVRDARQAADANPVERARKDADEAEKQAVAAEQMAEAATMPAPARAMNAPRLKKAAEDARKRADDLKKKAEAAEKVNKEATAKLQKQRADEEKAREKGAKGASSKGKKSADMSREDLEDLTKEELSKKLDKAKIEYHANDTKAELIDKLMAGKQDDTRTDGTNSQG